MKFNFFNKIIGKLNYINLLNKFKSNLKASHRHFNIWIEIISMIVEVKSC